MPEKAGEKTKMEWIEQMNDDASRMYQNQEIASSLLTDVLTKQRDSPQKVQNEN